MKKLIVFLLCFFSTSITFSQISKVDSLLLNLDKEENPDKKINDLKQVVDNSYAYKDRRIDSLVRVYYDLANKLNNDYHLGYSLKISGKLASSNYDFDKAKTTAHNAIKVFRKINNERELSGIYYDLGLTFNKERKYLDSAKYYIKKRIEIEKDSLRIVNSYYQLGKIFKNSKIIDSATIYYDKALQIALIKNYKQNIIKTITRLGELYNLIIEYDKGRILLETYLDSLSTNVRYTMNNGAFLGTLGNSYLGLKNYKKAIETYKKSTSFYLSTSARKGYSSATFIYFQMAQTALELDDLAKAEIYLDSSQLLAKKTKFNSQGNLLKSGIYLTKSKLLSKKGNLTKSIEILKKADEVLIDNDFSARIEIHRLFSENYANLGDYKNSLKHKDLEINYRDSLYKSENLTNVTEVETKYQTEKKEKENLQLRNEKIEQELKITQENRQKWVFALALLAALITLGVFYFYYRKNKRQKQVIESLQKELHHRVKNNLSIIDSFIEVAKEEFSEDKFNNKLTELQNRVDSINEVHQQLYKNKDVTNLNLSKYIETLSNNVINSFPKNDITIEKSVEDNLNLNADKSFPIGLIINEFLTNSYKYAFGDDGGKVKIKIKKTDSKYNLTLSDNGKGLPKDFNIKTSESFGLRIIKLLAEQLDGSFELNNIDGVVLNISFPT